MKTMTIILAALTASVAVADTVTLKSGSYLKGTVGEAKNGELKFNSEDLGEITIKLENIVRLENAGSHQVLFNDGTVMSNVLSVVDGRYVVGQKPLDMTKVKTIDPVPETWHGSVHLGYQGARGNTYENSGSVLAHLDRRWEKDRLNVDFGYAYSDTGTSGSEVKKTTDRWEAEVKHDHFWFPKVYHYEDLRYDRDVIQQLNARYRVGLGLGYQWLEKSAFETTGVWSFNQELGANWIKEEYEENPDEKKSGYCALRYAHHLLWAPKWVAGLDVFHNAEILPEADDWEKFLAKVDLGFTTKLILDFDLIVKVEYDYDSKPAGDRKKDDLRGIVGLGYQW